MDDRPADDGTAPYLAWAPGDGVVPAARAALEAADDALRDRPCEHETHPYREHEAESDEDLAGQLCGLADREAAWEENHPREQWLCPRNVAGLARIAPGRHRTRLRPDVPPRLPVGAQDTIDTLSAIPHGYADPGTDIGEEISCQRESCAPPNPRTGPDVCWSPWRSPDTPPPTPYGTPPHSKN